MKYPTLEEVEAADRIQLGKWYRFLHSPGLFAIGNPDYSQEMARELAITKAIGERFASLGGWSPRISKIVGWERPL